MQPRDSLVSSHLLAATPNPQQLCWLAMHQDYSATPVYNCPTIGRQDCEHWYGERVIDKCLKFGHWGVTEHPQISINCCYYPHSVLQQARTHRVGISFDCQSFRYTADSVLSINTYEDLERAIYFRPIGAYVDRKGHKYEYTEVDRDSDLMSAMDLVEIYKRRINKGHSEEHARGMLPFDYRQHFVVSFNARSLMHFLDLRSKKDAQLEIQWLAEDLFALFKQWMPEVAAFYEDTRLHKARLSP